MVSYALNTKVCFQKKKKEERKASVVVAVVTVVLFLFLSHAIIIETVPWHAGLIPPEVSSLEREAKRVGK